MLLETNEKVHECDVIFVGEEGAGKTSVINRLTEGKDPHQRAENVATIPWNGKYNDIPMRLRCVDFGGTIKWSQYRSFYTSDTVYVVVCNVRQGDFQRKAERWLSELDEFAPGCPVIVLLNVIVVKGMPPGYDEYDFKALAEHNEKFNDDLRAGTNHQYRITAIRPDYAEKEIPSQFSQFLKTLDDDWKRMQDDILFQAYLLISKKTQKTMGTFNSQNQVMDPCRVAVGLGLLMDGCKCQDCQYIFKKTDARIFLNDVPGQPLHDTFEQDEEENLLNLLTQREILFRIPSNGRYNDERLLIEERIPANVKEHLSEHARNRIYRDFRGNRNALHYQCEIEPSVPQNLHLHMLGKDIGILEEDCLWKYGAVFRDNGSGYSSMIEIGYVQNHIDIYVAGQNIYGEHCIYLKKLIVAVEDCIRDKHFRRKRRGGWRISNEKILFTENITTADGTTVYVDCEVDYRNVLKKEEEKKSVCVSALNKDMDPAYLLHKTDRTRANVVNRVKGISTFFEVTGKFCQNVGATFPFMKGLFQMLKKMLVLIARFLKILPVFA